jgi:hypothetical protein
MLYTGKTDKVHRIHERGEDTEEHSQGKDGVDMAHPSVKKLLRQSSRDS